MSIDKLIGKIKKGKPVFNIGLIRDAYEFAEVKHKGQKRFSGEAFINHPFEVAFIISSLGLDEQTIAAALLHDTLEDTETTKRELEEKFGKVIADLVDGVTKLGEIDMPELNIKDFEDIKSRVELESLRKFFLAMAKDIRVVIIKLADRLHNLRTLDPLPQDRQKNIAWETLEIYAPLADRLGMGELKVELEDIAFKYINPSAYAKLAKEIEATKRERLHYLSKVKRFIVTELKKEKIEVEIDGRVKHFYSIFKKLEKVQGDFSKIYDLMAVRIVVDSVEDCYKVLGIIHKHFKPLIYRIKDYIAVPKPNGYRSLHTTVFCLDGRITEFQIRTREMHQESERGVAAHWYYDQSKEKNAYKGKTSSAPDNMNWVGKIMDWQQNAKDDEEFAEALKIDLFNDRIFVFSPRGDIFDLPEGATPVDFAFEVHTKIGEKCRGAKVNGKIVPLDHKLENRDFVEIILGAKNDKSGPSRHWLDFVKTTKAKQRIRSFYKRLNRDENIIEGSKLLVSELAILGMTEGDLTDKQKNDLISESGWKEWEDVLSALGEGAITARQIIKKLIGQKIYLKKELTGLVLTDEGGEKDSYSNLSGILVRYAACCRPKKGDEIMGFITRGQGITIHTSTCPNLLASPKEKIINIDFEIPQAQVAEVTIEGESRIGFIRDVSSAISKEDINILEIRSEPLDDTKSKVYLKLSLDNPDKIADLLFKLKVIDGVSAVKKQ